MRFSVLLAICIGCVSPESAVRSDNGKDLVICVPHGKTLSACRDGVGRFWICETIQNAECIRVDQPAKDFAVRDPSSVEVPPK